MKKLLILLLVTTLSGCATTYRPVDVVVPVPCPSPQIPPNPKLYIADIKADSSPEFIAKSYVATVYQLITVNGALVALLQTYKH